MYFSYIKTERNAEEAPQVICERLAQGGDEWTAGRRRTTT